MNDATRVAPTAKADGGGRHATGVLLVLGSAVAFSLAGVLTKTVPCDAWVVMSWRGLFSIPPILAYVAWRGRGRPISTIFRLGWKGWALASVSSCASAAFIASFKLTYVANVVAIYSTVPFIAAGLGWLVLRERIRASTLAAAAAALAGVSIMVSGGMATGHLVGDLLAMGMTIGMALCMVLIRLLRETPAVLAVAASSLQLFVAGWLVADPTAVSARDLTILALFGFAFALAAVLLTEGTKLIPAAEAGLLGAAEMPLAPLLAWLALGELPPRASLFGGAIVLAAVLTHAGRDLLDMGARRRRTAGQG